MYNSFHSSHLPEKSWNEICSYRSDPRSIAGPDSDATKNWWIDHGKTQPNPKCDTCAVHIVIITSAYSRWWTFQTCRPINFSSRILEVQVLQGWSANSTLQPSASSQPLCCQLLRCSQTNLEGEAVLHSSQPPHAHTIYAMHMQHIGILPPNHYQKFHTNVQHYVTQWPQRVCNFAWCG